MATMAPARTRGSRHLRPTMLFLTQRVRYSLKETYKALFFPSLSLSFSLPPPSLFAWLRGWGFDGVEAGAAAGDAADVEGFDRVAVVDEVEGAGDAVVGR